MKTENNCKDLFNDLPDNELLKGFLCEEKFPGVIGTESIGLNEFIRRLWKKYDIKDENELLEKTLLYLYPLLKKGELIVKVTEEICGKGKIYKKEEAKQAIKDIKKEWINCKNEKERKDLLEFRVQFIIPGGGFIY